MKTPLIAALLSLSLMSPLIAQNTVITTTSNAASETANLSEDALDTLVGPIALYPDVLIGIILPASTNPTDIVLASRYLENNKDNQTALDQIDQQPWEQSVRALARYPDVLHWMDENLAWTEQLGQTFLAQSDDMMKAIQRLRSKAENVGNLQSTEQLTVINDDDYIRIIPAQREYVYVPYYDPDVVYVSRTSFYYGPAWFGGPWLAYDCNWIGGSIWIGTWSPNYYYRPAWRPIDRRPLPPNFNNTHTWRPVHPPPPRPARPPQNIVRPRPPEHPTTIERTQPGTGGRTNNGGRPNWNQRPNNGSNPQQPPPTRRERPTNFNGQPNDAIPNPNLQSSPPTTTQQPPRTTIRQPTNTTTRPTQTNPTQQRPQRVTPTQQQSTHQPAQPPTPPTQTPSQPKAQPSAPPPAPTQPAQQTTQNTRTVRETPTNSSDNSDNSNRSNTTTTRSNSDTTASRPAPTQQRTAPSQRGTADGPRNGGVGGGFRRN